VEVVRPTPSEIGIQVSRATALSTVLFIVAIATFVQALLVLKLVVLSLFLSIATVDALVRRRRLLYPRILWFYAIVGIIGAAWALVGLWRPGNYVMGVLDAVRLYVGWSAAFVVILSIMRATVSLSTVHAGLVWGGILISLVNAVAVADQLLGWGLIGVEIRQEMYLSIGILDGFARINSINIGSLFLILPYLLTLQFLPDSRAPNTLTSKVALILCLGLAAASGRRALWLVVFMTPFTIVAVSALNGSLWLAPRPRRIALMLYCAATFIAPFGLFTIPGVRDLAPVEHVAAAFSDEDERSIQSGYLLGSWSRVPYVGSGFGAYAGYERSELRPWTYELTYHRMLFNLGLVGTAALAALFVFYFASAIRASRRGPYVSQAATALVVGLLSLLLGAYSNPYLGSFDYLLLLGLLPYLTTGPAVPAPGARGRAR